MKFRYFHAQMAHVASDAPHLAQKVTRLCNFLNTYGTKGGSNVVTLKTRACRNERFLYCSCPYRRLQCTHCVLQWVDTDYAYSRLKILRRTFLDSPLTVITLRAKLSGAVYCYRSCLCVCVLRVCNGWAGGRAACVCGTVTTITRNCVHRSSPNWVCR